MIRARVMEKATRIRTHFAWASPDAAQFRLLAGHFVASVPRPLRRVPDEPDPDKPMFWRRIGGSAPRRQAVAQRQSPLAKL